MVHRELPVVVTPRRLLTALLRLQRASSPAEELRACFEVNLALDNAVELAVATVARALRNRGLLHEAVTVENDHFTFFEFLGAPMRAVRNGEHLAVEENRLRARLVLGQLERLLPKLEEAVLSAEFASTGRQAALVLAEGRFLVALERARQTEGGLSAMIAAELFFKTVEHSARQPLVAEVESLTARVRDLSTPVPRVST